MFELSDTAMERVMFAMEDQDRSFMIDLSTGDAVPMPAEGLAPDSCVPPPSWSSRDGFRVMESWHAGLRNPALRRELSAVLARGKGVFKAFKETLSAWPDAEKSFKDFKARAMRKRIESWLDDQREVHGLARLQPEPEDLSDIFASDFEVRVEPLSRAPKGLAELVGKAEAESLDYLPAAAASREAAALAEALRTERHGHCAFVEDGDGGLLGCAFGFSEESRGRACGEIRFLYVQEGFRKMGLGISMLSALRSAFVAEGIGAVVFDSLLLPQEYAEALAARGYRNLGVRMAAPAPD